MKNTMSEKGVMMNAGNSRGQVLISNCTKASEAIPAGYAAKERLFNEIQNLKDAVFQLSAKLDPISYRAPREDKPVRGDGAYSEYFQSIHEASNMVEDIRDMVTAMYQDVEL